MRTKTSGLHWRARLVAPSVATLLAAIVFFASSAWGATTQELFRIERSTNRNAVVYAARLNGKVLDPANPVSAFWLMLERGGGREELTWLERELAYGFSTSKDTSGVVLRLVAFDKRTLRVRKFDSRYRAEVPIAGKLAHLERIYVKADDGLLGPHVRYVQLDGVDVRTGQRLTERITH